MNGRTYHIGFLIFDGFPMACLTSMIEPLRAANEISQTHCFSWELLSETSNKIKASANVVFDIDNQLRMPSRHNAIILLSPPSAHFNHPNTAGTLRAMDRHGAVIGAVSGGIFPLARAHLIRNLPISVHWCYAAAFTQEFPHIHASDQVLEIQGNIITASGAGAAFDLALNLINARLGTEVAAEVAAWFQHPIMRSQGFKQIIPHLNVLTGPTNMPDAVCKAIEIVQNNLSETITIQEIADLLGITTRHLSRQFKLATNQNPSQYFRMIRMNAARQMVLYTNKKINEIALAVGYPNTTALKQHYNTEFKNTPQEDRARQNSFRVLENSPLPSLQKTD